MRAALAFAEAVEGSNVLSLRTPEEAEAVFTRFVREWETLIGHTPPVRDGATIRYAGADSRMMHFLAAKAFRARFADTWALDEDDEEEE